MKGSRLCYSVQLVILPGLGIRNIFVVTQSPCGDKRLLKSLIAVVGRRNLIVGIAVAVGVLVLNAVRRCTIRRSYVRKLQARLSTSPCGSRMPAYAARQDPLYCGRTSPGRAVVERHAAVELRVVLKHARTTWAGGLVFFVRADIDHDAVVDRGAKARRYSCSSSC
jgi:hypothetical protein